MVIQRRTKSKLLVAIGVLVVVAQFVSILRMPEANAAPGDPWSAMDASSISGGNDSSCAIKAGAAYCWGANYVGQLGIGTDGGQATTPTAVDASGVLAGKVVTNIVAGSAGADEICALADGQAYCWGKNEQGQLGNATNDSSNTPVAVDTSGVLAGKTITDLSVGYAHVCALADGQAYCWGYGSNGQLGNNDTADSPIPVAVDTSGVLAGKTVRSIRAGSTHTCALADGQAYCWGRNNAGQLGNNDTADSPIPVAVDTSGDLDGKTVTDLSAGSDHNCALADGQAYCWGIGYSGQLGNATTSGGISNIPVAVDTSGVLAGKTISSISSGEMHTCALADGQAYCWGGNAYSELGDTTSADSPIPVTVDTSGVLAGKTVANLASGKNHACVAADGGMYCWGSNNKGQLGNAVSTFDSVNSPVTVLEPGSNAKRVTGVSFSEVGGRKLMNVTGVSFVEGAEWADAINRSLVTFNGTPLRFCLHQSMIDNGAIDSVNPQFYTASPPCYDLLDYSTSSVFVTSTQVTIWLPDDFNSTIEGTVSVNDSPVFTYNEGVFATPHASVNGNRPLDHLPIIPKRPTFTGTGAPGATIRVTVHSDPVICETTTDSDGDWSCTLSQDLPDGLHTVYIQVTNPDNSVTELGPYSVQVGGTVTNNTPLAPNSGVGPVKDGPNLLVRVGGLVLLLLVSLVYVVRRLVRSS